MEVATGEAEAWCGATHELEAPQVAKGKLLVLYVNTREAEAWYGATQLETPRPAKHRLRAKDVATREAKAWYGATHELKKRSRALSTSRRPGKPLC